MSIIDPREFPYGSGAFASDEDVRRAFRAPGGLPIAFHQGRLLTHSGRQAALLCSSSGAGKWATVLSHLALTPGRGGEPQRVVFLDIKAEGYCAIGQGLCSSNAHGWSYNPYAMFDVPQHTISLLSHLKPDSRTLFADARAIARALLPEGEDDNSRFFQLAGQSWLEALIVGLVCADGGVSFASLYALVGLIRANPDAWIDRAAEMAACGPFDLEVIYKQIIEMMAQSPRTADSIMAGIVNSLSWLSDPNMRGSLLDDESADFTLDVLMEDSNRPVWVFICIPAELVGQNAPFLRVLLSVLRTLKRRKPDSPTVTAVLDEAAQLHRAPEIGDMFAVDRAIGLTATAVYQDLSQIRRNLGPTGAQTLIANAAVEIYLGGGISDLETAQNVSRRLGNQTLVLDDPLTQMRARRAKREAVHAMLFDGADPVKTGMAMRHLDEEIAHTRKIARPLMSPDEILNMPQDKALVIASGCGIRPFIADKVPYYTLRRYAGRMFPNPYFDRDLESVKVKTLFGMRRRRVIEEPVPERYADFPQYRNGTWKYIEGYRPKT